MKTLKIEYFEGGQDSPYRVNVCDFRGQKSYSQDIAENFIKCFKEEKTANYCILSCNDKKLFLYKEEYKLNSLNKDFAIISTNPFNYLNMIFDNLFYLVEEKALKENADISVFLEKLEIKEKYINLEAVKDLEIFLLSL